MLYLDQSFKGEYFSNSIFSSAVKIMNTDKIM